MFRNETGYFRNAKNHHWGSPRIHIPLQLCRTRGRRVHDDIARNLNQFIQRVNGNGTETLVRLQLSSFSRRSSRRVCLFLHIFLLKALGHTPFAQAQRPLFRTRKVSRLVRDKPSAPKAEMIATRRPIP